MLTLHSVVRKKILCAIKGKKLVPAVRKNMLGAEVQNNLGAEVEVLCAKMRKKIFFFLRFLKNFGHLAHEFMIFFGHLAHQSCN